MPGIGAFVPAADSTAVKTLRQSLGVNAPALPVEVRPEPSARELNCFATVKEKIVASGGRMQLGWAVWQHENLFAEGEFHAVYDPGDGGPWIDLTPHFLDVPRITFVSDAGAAYDFGSTDVIDNHRVALVPDTRVNEALRLFSEKTRLLNTIPGIDVTADQVDPGLILKLGLIEEQAMGLLESAQFSQRTGRYDMLKIGRNDPCPCGGGKKFKRCHGFGT